MADYVDLYRNTDLFLCPLTNATACNGLNEAMASGLPILIPVYTFFEKRILSN